MQEMVLRFFSIIILMVTGSINGLGQNTDALRGTTEDGYIENMGDKLAIDLSFNNSYETFEVRSGNSRTVLYPNAKTNVHLKANYRFISFGVRFAPGLLPGNGDEDLKGETKSFGLATAFIFRHWFADMDYTKVKGYYLENSADFIRLPPGDPFIQFPDLHYKGVTLTTGYSSNARFSFRSLTSQTERQLKNVGSFVPVINMKYYTVDDKSSSPTTQKSRNIEASVGPGYTYTFVAKETFYLSLGISGSVGYLNTKLWTRGLPGDNVSYQDNFILRWDGKTGVGYNGPKFYTGLYANVSGTRYEQENTTVHNFDTRVYYHIFFGIRIDAPNLLNRNVNRLEEKIKSSIEPSKRRKINK